MRSIGRRLVKSEGRTSPFNSTENVIPVSLHSVVLPCCPSDLPRGTSLSVLRARRIPHLPSLSPENPPFFLSTHFTHSTVTPNPYRSVFPWPWMIRTSFVLLLSAMPLTQSLVWPLSFFGNAISTP